MKKVKTFLHVFNKSLIPSINYYRKIVYTRFTFSFKYFFFLVLSINLLLSFVWIINYNPFKIKHALSVLNDSFINAPANLKIKIINGQLISSYSYPYFHWLDDQKKLLLVVDESADSAKVNIYNSYLLISKNELVINFKKINKNLDNLILPLSVFNNFEINKNNLYQLVKRLDFLINYFYFFYLLILFFFFTTFFIASFLTTFFYLILASFIVYLIFIFFIKKSIHYQKILQISFHAVTFPLIIDYLPVAFLPGLKLQICQQLPFFVLPLTIIVLITIFNFAGAYYAYLNIKDKHKHN